MNLTTTTTTITIAAVNDAPLAADDAFTMNEDGTVISGNWYIRPRSKGSGATMGTWIATRGDGGEEFTFDIDQTKDEINDEVKKELEVPTQPALR